MTNSERTFEVRDIDGSNPRQMTVAQYRAELDAAKAKAMVAARQMYGDRFIDRLVNR
jgi:hypothetical protein